MSRLCTGITLVLSLLITLSFITVAFADTMNDEYILEISIDENHVSFADHNGTAEGNWIALSGGTAKSVPVTIEVLKQTSELVKETPEGTVYKNLNIWVGYEGFSIPKNIKDAILEFNVNTAWLEENNIEPHRVFMKYYNSETDKWETVPTTYIETLDGIAYYQATPDSSSPFAIVGMEDKDTQKSIYDLDTETDHSYQDNSSSIKKTMFTSNLITLIAGVIILAGTLVSYRKNRNKE
ncbi:PGF-pre-PGF domain-containing protein [Methanococcoides seepicolus]|uniref:PGF-pre-PGF domain-containing protein n=1 Tax=Methanococcoides seepicolus TaxID=2828780 RepID=A0A9E5D802_9EURY|nr:PGF-pre-PGF domain-containing protein [Methanococcoides seepicolus]MCM1985495.1 PGF-pre-PGF domain-containing protein [Methanococcoides seepicolus]